MSRKISFSDRNDGVWFEHSERPPAKFLPLGKKGGRINLSALFLYAMYRTAVFDSYKSKPDLADDIKSRQRGYDEKETPALSQNPIYNNPVHHYSVAASLGAMKEWLDPNENMECFFAYQNVNGRKTIVGFVHFQQKTINGSPVVYIAQAGVINRSSGVGRRLMECVLSHYLEGTHFKILTRVFNTEAKTLYQSRLNFLPISAKGVSQLGYDNRYCGFEHTTSRNEVEAIKKKQITNGVDRPTLFQRANQSAEQHNTYCGFKPGFLLGKMF